MPGHFNVPPTLDGAVAETGSSAHAGVFGKNTATVAPTGGGAGGAGVFGLTQSPGGAGVFGSNGGPSGVGVQGNGPDAGLSGFSDQGDGARAFSKGGHGAFAETNSSSRVGVFGNNTAPDAPSGGGAGGAGVFGLSQSPGGAGVFGSNGSASGVGVQGNGPDAGVSGISDQGDGIRAFSTGGHGAFAETNSSSRVGVFGNNTAADAPSGGGAGGAGVFGLSQSPGGAGVFGSNGSASGVGVQGNGPDAGVSGFSSSVGVRAESSKIGLEAQAPTAGRFVGDVEVTGEIRLVNADCAEDFDVHGATAVEPGTVMVADTAGGVRVSEHDYDSRVVGVVSGAGGYSPAMILDRQHTGANRLPLALMGKVYCRVDSTEAPISIGDLLTTSSTRGHAMKAVDRDRAFGAVIGKALQSFDHGRGVIAILVALQ